MEKGRPGGTAPMGRLAGVAESERRTRDGGGGRGQGYYPPQGTATITSTTGTWPEIESMVTFSVYGIHRLCTRTATQGTELLRDRRDDSGIAPGIVDLGSGRA
jgi:hypothetical protein